MQNQGITPQSALSVIKHGFFSNPEKQASNFSAPLLQATLPDSTVIEFEENNVKPDGNCGFIALGTNREALSEKLLLLKEDEKIREFLAEEIMNAFFTYGATDGNEGLAPPIASKEAWEKTSKKYEEIQKKFDALFYKISNALSDKSAITQDDMDASIAWLKNNNKNSEADALTNCRIIMVNAHAALLSYCKNPLVFNYYVNALRNTGLWLGYKSALLYAKNTNITLYIWRKSTTNKSQLELIDRHIVNGNASNEIHMLHTDGFTHFNLLSKPLANKSQDNFIKIQKNAEPSSNIAYEAYLQKEEKMLAGINFEKLCQLMEHCKKGIEPAKGRDLILLVGRTGAGKSTTLNYLMGSKLKRTKKGTRVLLNVQDGEKVYAEIGHNLTESKTLFPQVVLTTEYQQLAYADLPGIRDTRILEEKLCASIAFPMTVQYARSIRGIICVIDVNDMTTGRGEAFVDLLKVLGGLLKNPTALNTNQLLFVFTKVSADDALEDVLETIKDAKEELLKTQKKHEEELNKIIQSLATNVNMLTEWTKANQSGNEEDKLKMQTIIMEKATKDPFNVMPEIKNIFDRCKILGEEAEKAVMQLMGMELILKHAEHTNLFIIRGNEKDDKKKLLKSIANLQMITPISKEEFALSGNKDGEWNILDKVIQKIAVAGTELLNAQSNYTSEISILKKYKKLVEKQKNQQAQLLTKLKTSTLKIDELERIREEISTLAEELNNSLSKNSKEKRSEKARLEKELILLDTTKPTRYRHRNLEPVVFTNDGNVMTEFVVPTTSISIGILLLPLGVLALIGGIIGGTSAGIIGGISEGIMSGSSGSVGEAMGEGIGIGMLTPALLLYAMPTMMPMSLKNSHFFQYDDLPFIHAKRKLDPPRIRNNNLLQDKKQNKKGKKRLSEGFPEKFDKGFYEGAGIARDFMRSNFSKSGFDLSTQVMDPVRGKYEITYVNMPKIESSKKTIWIELFVEKRIHPEFKAKIEIIKKKLNRLEFVTSCYFKHDLEQLAKAVEKEKLRLNTISNKNELQSALCNILEDRLSQYQNRLETLHGCILGYQSRVKECSQEILRQNPQYTMLKQITEIIGQTNTFAKDFLSAYENYLMQENTKPLTSIWGRKNSPAQQPSYQVENDKPDGCSIGAVFKPQDKPYSAGWYGKLGYWCHLSPSESTLQLAAYTQARRATALEAVAEKIAADLYHYLSDGNYYVPKTRLAELPIGNCFTEKHGSTKELLKKINQGREEKIEDGVYVMSKRIENYKDLVKLKGCLLGEELLDFQQCLERGKLPEEVIIENKKIPLKGLMEILAASRLLGDTDVLGGSGKNAGFLIERDANGQAIAVRAVKIDPGLAFNFRGESNLFYQSKNSAAPSTNLLTMDKRHLQYGNMATKPLLWTNLTEAQQKQFILALDAGIKLLSNTEEIASKFANRKAFELTPNQRQLPQAKECLKDLKENLAWQEKAYEKELAELKNTFSYRI